MAQYFNSIPKVDKVLALQSVETMLLHFSRKNVLSAVRNVLSTLRESSNCGALAEPISEDMLLQKISSELKKLTSPSLYRVVNGTGVVVHTNLGRSLLADSACRQIVEAAKRYSNLELDISTGKRGERYEHIEPLLSELTGAEAAIAVNNNAAAVLLALSSIATGREVIVSRGELVEIGGSFRIPEVMRLSGAILKEVGTTNRTHKKDYESAISSETALLLKVHASNFSVVGFTASLTIEELVKLGKEHSIPVMADIGSGSILDLSKYGIAGEKPVSEYIKAGVDIVTFSGDKLLGAGQCGIIAGKKEIISQLKRCQLLRALRIDKLTLAALEATLRLYRDEREAVAEIPTLKMLTITLDELKKRAKSWIRKLRLQAPLSVTFAINSGESQVGGGALPLLNIPTFLISINSSCYTAQKIDEIFRNSSTPILGRIYKGEYLLDLRTLLNDDIDAVAAAVGRLK